VPVLTALDNAGGVYEAILPSLAAIEVALDGRIAAGSVVCSDGTTAYVKAAVTAGAEYRRVVVPTITPIGGEGRSGAYFDRVTLCGMISRAGRRFWL
jgi:hypothetical protein